MTKVTPFLAGQIVQHFMSQKVPRVSATAAHFNLSWKTIEKVLASGPPAGSLQQPRKVSAAVQARRNKVRILANMRGRRGNAEYCLYPSAPAIQEQLSLKGINVSVHTVRRDLKILGYKSVVRRFVPTRDPGVVKRRWVFGQGIRKGGKSILKKIVFSDEHVMNSNDHSHRRMWVRPGQKLLTREKKRVQNCFRVHVWAAIGLNYKSPIILLKASKRRRDDDETESSKRKLCTQNSDTYIRRCLSKVVPSIRGRTFMQDGAKAHTANRTLRYLHEKGVNVIQNWPSHSPDLNPIEEMWALLNQRVAERHPKSQEELERLTVEVWNAITMAEVNAYVNSFWSKINRMMDRCGEA